MSSDLQSASEFLFTNDYASLVVVTVVVYDYILTFSKEIEYVWCRPWTWVSTLFVIVRYSGFCWIMTSALNCSSFVHGLLEVRTVSFLISTWAFIVFLSAADLVMILRVYAMWNRSRTILCVLSLIYVLQVVTSIVFNGIYNNPATDFSVDRVLNFSFCNPSFTNAPPTHNVYIVVPRLVLGATLMILTVFQTLKQSFEMYKLTKAWQPNRYMKVLARDGILYFFVNLLYQITSVLCQGEPLSNNASILFLNAVVDIIFYPLIPRFIISIRELYAHDIQGRFHIDTGFGVLSQPNDAVSIIVFTDIDLGRQGPKVEEDMDDSDGVSLEAVVEYMGQV
ncbi:hypothetical protein L210DRAFT_2061202 [Boletus edulis BED1]|uniref:DUF6533 domain-containing protein n=1 Tax=Boletus edulis BED1 TaxID=1328754 RepID=A0AAD4GNM3_BOLED|nr:hypothetical protein L210DRAFT_2061202 [Boletus edulis BED1]